MLRRLLTASLGLAASALAATINVPGDQPTIQRGINAAFAGDTVLVAAGTYYETFDFIGKDLVLKGQRGPANTMVSGDSLSPVVTMNGGETPAAILEGFTVTGGLSGILIENSSPTLTRSRITGNSAQRGGGIHCDNSSPVLEDCAIVSNTADSQGGGLYCANESSPILENCRIDDNSATSRGGGIYCDSSSPTLTSCTISGNIRGGLYCGSESSPTLTSCSVLGNELQAGVYCANSNPLLTNCVITGNTTDSQGGGLYCSGSSPVMKNCLIVGNTASQQGGGIYCNESSPTLTNCTFSDNTATSYGGGIYSVNNLSAILTNCILWGDTPDEIWGEVVTVTYCDVQGDYPGEGNFGIDPRFVTYHGYEYLLHPHSPCVDAGDPALEDGIYDWHPRWPNFYQDGPRSDMGAYGGPGNIGWLP